MAKYRKKPVVIDAVQWIGQDFWEDKVKNKILIEAYEEGHFVLTHGVIYIKTLEGDMVACFGDYIIKGTHGEFYPVKSDIFEANYEKVKDNG